jgi:hypothetical protein
MGDAPTAIRTAFLWRRGWRCTTIQWNSQEKHMSIPVILLIVLAVFVIAAAVPNLTGIP